MGNKKNIVKNYLKIQLKHIKDFSGRREWSLFLKQNNYEGGGLVLFLEFGDRTALKQLIMKVKKPTMFFFNNHE